MPKQPNNLFSIEDAKELDRLTYAATKCDEWEAIRTFWEQRATAINECVKAWTALEELTRRATVDDLNYYYTPGIFALRLSCIRGLDGFSLEMDEDQEWQWPTLHETIRAAVADIIEAEEKAKVEDVDDAE